MASEKEVHGMFIGNALRAARQLSVALAQNNATLSACDEPTTNAIMAVVDSINGLAKYEAQAVARGLLRPHERSDSEQLAQRLAAAAGVMKLDASQRQAVMMADDAVEATFDMDDLMADPNAPAPVEEPADDFNL